jgi:hypothetical protein
VKALIKTLRWRWVLLLAALTPTCRRIVEQASRAHEEPVSAYDRFRLQVHLGICTACRRYLRQLDFLREASARSAENVPAAARVRLADGAKERLKHRLRCERVG